MNRRRALQALGAGLALGMSNPLRLAANSASRPNVVFVLTDDQRHEALGFLTPWLTTPNLDRLAREGVHFDHAFVTNSLCGPSRASYLSGVYPHCHGVLNNLTPWPTERETFLDWLKAAGYRVGFVGKWHMPGEGIPDLVGLDRVDRMVTFSFLEGQGIYWDCPILVDGEELPTDGYITDILSDYALEFLDEQKSKREPFCLYLSQKAMHGKFHPATRHLGKLDHMKLPEIESLETDHLEGPFDPQKKKEFRKIVQGYYETLFAVDESIGQILTWLDDRGLAENTLVIFTSDNGYMWGEHGLLGKRYAFEESMRVPLILRYPRLVEGGRSVSDLVHNLDLAPTILDAAGVDVPSSVQGTSYLPLAQGRPQEKPRRAFLYEYFRDPPFPQPRIVALRTRRWKYVHYPDGEHRDELYDLKTDPRERTNLVESTEHSKTRDNLRARLRYQLTETAC